ncbi:MAG: site-specific integrase [Deltaproteobacteria bacterium]|nr:site-specific integrase [Deltaproteobacteria bacterium]MBT4089078.1 site-specific integrase [Deltaproteobacteria bacterium]MBT4266942.1 site-specific integrase [Deltaproteobacteria bacterium]MBT4637460.1 site-specific integrase [Deltaproteobacteria bacterium]MBT6502809.1 site-specific integrase [Deltaproteobacteria bacterium]
MGISGIKPFHSLRGWAITLLLAQGHPILMVQDMVGHEDAKTTMGYWNLMKNSSSELVGHLSSVTSGLLQNIEVFDVELYQ